MKQAEPLLNQLNVIVRDMNASVAFYRELGLEITAEPGASHVEVEFANGLRLELDSSETLQYWDSGYAGQRGGSSVLGFGVASRDGIDSLYAKLVRAGYSGRQRPYDAFWGARYAIVEDPDGNPVGLMSPIDKERKYWPPTAAPKE